MLFRSEVWDSTLTTKRGSVFISTAASGTTLKAKVIGGSTIATVDNDVFIVVGTVKGEGDVAGTAWADELKVVRGECGIMETPIEITGTLYEAALRGYSKELSRLRTQKSQEHDMQKERTFLFGKSVIGTGLADSRDGSSVESFTDGGRTDVNGKLLRSTMGLVTALDAYGTASGDDQNLFTINQASYKYSDFVDDMEKVFHYYPEPGIKYALCGPGAMSYWSKLDGSAFMVGKSGWQVKIGDTQKSELGFNIRMLETPHGVLALVMTPALRGPYNKRMIVLSDENLTHVQYRPPQFLANIKTDNGYDGEKDLYRSDEGLGMTLIESHKSFTIV